MAYIPGFGYLNNPYIVFTDANGKPLSNGTVETYIAGTTTAYNTLKDWNGTYNGAIITLDIYGGCTIIAPETQGLKLIVKTSTGLLYKTFPNVFIGGSNQGYLPGTTVIRVDGTDGEIISVGVPDPSDPDKLIFTISLDPSITDAIARNTDHIDGLQIHVGTIENNITVINDTLDTLIAGDKAARSFPLSITETHYLKICDVDTDGTIPYHIDFLLYLSKNQLSLKFDEDVQGLMGTGTGSFKYLGQSCNPVFVYDVTPNTGRIVIFRTTPENGIVSFFLVSYNGYEVTDETVSIIDGHISGTTAVYSSGSYTTVAPTMASNSETIYLTHNIRVGTSCTGLGTYYSPIEAKATQVVSTNESIGIETTVTNGVTTHDLSVTGGQVDTYKVKTSSADAVPGFTYDKIIVEGILTKNKAASDTFGEVLQLAALVETDGETCSGNGTTNSPIVVFRDVSDNQNIWYLDTVNGLDTNSGLSRSAPKKTGDAVVIACKTAGKTAGRLVVMAGGKTQVDFTAANWANTAFPFFDVFCESDNALISWTGVRSGIFFRLLGGTSVFNSCIIEGISKIDVRACTLYGGEYDGVNLNVASYLIIDGIRSYENLIIQAANVEVRAAVLVDRLVKIQTNKLWGSGGFYDISGREINLEVQTNVFAMEGVFNFPSQAANSSIKITAAKMQRIATTRLLYLGANASGVTVNYQLVVDTMGSIVPLEIGNPAGTIAGKVIELLKYENKVDAEIIRATTAEALKANKLMTVNNSTSTDYTFVAADILTIHVVNSATVATRTVPSDTTAPTISVGDSIEIVQLGTGQVTLVADTGVTILTSLTLKTYGQNSVIEIRKIAANTWLCVGERAGS